MNKHGTYVNKSTDTSGLGEYSDAQLLKELVNRGVTTEVIGGMEYRSTIDPSLSSWSEEDYKAFGRNELRIDQHQRIKEIIGE